MSSPANQPEHDLVTAVRSGLKFDGNRAGIKSVIRADFLADLATQKHPDIVIHHRGFLISNSQISGNLDLSSSVLEFPVHFSECDLDEIDLTDAKCKSFCIEGGTVKGVHASGLNVEGNLLFSTEILGPEAVGLRRTKVSEDLEFCDGTYHGRDSDGVCINADGLYVGGDVFLRRSKFFGEIRLVGAEILGDLDCSGAAISNSDQDALSCDRAVIGKSLYLVDSFNAQGTVRLTDSHIGARIVCNNCTINGSIEKGALNGQYMKVAQEIELGVGFVSNGAINFRNAQFSGDVDCGGATLHALDVASIILEGATIAGALKLSGLCQKPNGVIDLSYAKCRSIFDDEPSWPASGKLVVEGFEYERLGNHSTKSALDRLEWLRLQDPERSSTQAYEIAASVFKRAGQLREATQILIERERLYRATEINRLIRGESRRPWILANQAWNWLLDYTVRFGYRPERMFLFMLAVVLFGVGIFYVAGAYDVMVPTKERVYMSEGYAYLKIVPPQYPVFEPIVYSIDAFFPIVDLHQEEYWIPDGHTLVGLMTKAWLWAEICFGWIMTTILVSALSGLFKKD